MIDKGDKTMCFIMQYLRHPRTVGAVKASSKYLAEKMTEDVDFYRSACIAEIGAGTGAFTEQIVRKKKDNTILLVFEINPEFCRILKKRFGKNPNVFIIHHSAEHMGKYLKKHGMTRADYIISGLPFASLPAKVSDRILEECSKCLARDGSFITFQYTRMKMALLKRFFSEITWKKEYRNLPPAYVMNCRKKGDTI